MTAPDVVTRNLASVRQTIADTARQCGRDPREIRLIAVSKTQPIKNILAVLTAGQIDFGENTAQEALSKIAELKNHPATWHFIGHLQSNKAKFIPGNFSWLHSLDNRALATRLARLAHEPGSAIETLIEVNVSRDPHKHGVMPEKLFALVEELLKETITGIALRGLMTLAPYPATESEIRNAFATARGLRDQCRQRFELSRFTELSMGMSGDYVHAIKEGATMLRLGTAIFGERAYP